MSAICTDSGGSLPGDEIAGNPLRTTMNPRTSVDVMLTPSQYLHRRPPGLLFLHRSSLDSIPVPLLDRIWIYADNIISTTVQEQPASSLEPTPIVCVDSAVRVREQRRDGHADRVHDQPAIAVASIDERAGRDRMADADRDANRAQRILVNWKQSLRTDDADRHDKCGPGQSRYRATPGNNGCMPPVRLRAPSANTRRASPRRSRSRATSIDRRAARATLRASMTASSVDRVLLAAP